ncbi:cell wall hydrolase [Mesobacillus selenatarsenatis]|uniref:Cell wall hydrolase n=1 Tax=Mesobacillus selenatarsenatis TaxID=388741 RepID=A0A846TIL4_9BACI|nr:cell wall hydrolase [Mesobacillus selenatarsenatis]NKE06629.1 cell wall hydrolase [Mesobacillus selenatarsenatis]
MKKIIMLVSILTLVIGSYTVYAETTKTNQADTLKTKKVDVDSKESSVTDKRFIKEEEVKLLARLVHAEAKGEPYEGKVAVAEVVLNRVENEQFPDSVKEVIYQKNAFQPVQNGAINKPANEEAINAVEDALENDNKIDSLYFYNPDTATSQWIFTREVVKTIGKHAFAI